MSNLNQAAATAVASLGKTLMVSAEAGTVQQVAQCAERFALAVETCSETGPALALLNTTKYAAVVVDLRLGDAAQGLIERVRKSPANGHAVIFAISENEVEAAESLRRGSTFVLSRPLTPAVVDRSFRTAYGLIVREQRRYFRCPVEVPIEILRTNLPPAFGQTINISEGGMSVESEAELDTGEAVQVRFTLSDDPARLVLEAKICWVKDGRLGVQFDSVPRDVAAKLHDWLNRNLEASLPQAVRDQFKNF